MVMAVTLVYRFYILIFGFLFVFHYYVINMDTFLYADLRYITFCTITSLFHYQ